jgi:hypothetical protein
MKTSADINDKLLTAAKKYSTIAILKRSMMAIRQNRLMKMCKHYANAATNVDKKRVRTQT